VHALNMNLAKWLSAIVRALRAHDPLPLRDPGRNLLTRSSRVMVLREVA
jgi:hypothetical protein